MDYGEVLSKAWKIVWKYKILWIFGILAGGGGGSSSGSSSFRQTQRQELNDLIPGYYLERVKSFIESIPVWVWVGLALGLVVLFLVSVFLNTVGRIGLIRGALEADISTPEAPAAITLGTLFNGSLRFFWRVFFFNLLVGIGIFLIVLIVFVPVVVATALTMGVALFCLVPLICALIPVFWLINLVVQQSNIAIIVEDLGMFEGLRHGWNLILKNIGNFIVMTLILAVGAGIINFVLALPIFLIVFPAAIGVAIGASSSNNTTIGATLAVSGIIFCLYMPILIVASGIVQTYVGTAWTLTYRRLSARSTTPPPGVSPEPPPSLPLADPFVNP
jgi:hypothetical protein